MKSPKILGQLTPGTAVGVAKARALQETGAPFLTARGSGYTTRLKNGFVSVTPDIAPTLEQPEPLFWVLSRAVPEKIQTDDLKRKVKTLAPGTTSIIGINSSVALNVGANRMVYTAEDRTALSVGSHGRLSWPVLGSSKTAGSFTTFPRNTEIIRSYFATGWDAARETWRWGYSAKSMGLYQSWVGPFSTSAPYIENIPKINLAGLDSTTLTEVVPPNEGDRVYYGATMHVVGPGKLAGLVTVGDFIAPGDTLPTTRRVTPYILTSDDHGATWTKTSAPFTVPFIKPATFGRWDADALRIMGSYSFFVYMGAGKSLFILRYLDITGANKQKSNVYLYESGTFTLISTGYDIEFFFSSNRVPTVGYNIAFIFQPPDGTFMEPDAFCFGPGCVALNTFEFADVTQQQWFSITRDYGATWTQVLVSSLLGPTYTSARMLPVRPYISDEAPGLIYLATFNFSETRIYATDGRFLSATPVKQISGTGWTGVTMINKSASPYPQLPNEFGPPPP